MSTLQICVLLSMGTRYLKCIRLFWIGANFHSAYCDVWLAGIDIWSSELGVGWGCASIAQRVLIWPHCTVPCPPILSPNSMVLHSDCVSIVSPRLSSFRLISRPGHVFYHTTRASDVNWLLVCTLKFDSLIKWPKNYFMGNLSKTHWDSRHMSSRFNLD